MTNSTLTKPFFTWKRSVWKLLMNELLIWLFIYSIISLSLHFLFFETMMDESSIKAIRLTDELMMGMRGVLTMVLSFYVSIIGNRWSKIIKDIPYPDSIAMSIYAFYKDQNNDNDQATKVRIIRHLMLGYILIFREISEKIQKKYPKINNLLPDMACEAELKLIAGEKTTDQLPIQWVLLSLKTAWKENKITNKRYTILVNKVFDFHKKLQYLQQFDFVNVPLAYAQIVNLAMFLYLSMALVAKQFIGIEYEENVNYRLNYGIPFLMIFEFIFFAGWLKIAQVMMNPFGMDDEDFQLEVMIERNLKVATQICCCSTTFSPLVASKIAQEI